MSEQEVRKLRDRIYGISTDKNWDACRDNWMREDSVTWLKDHQPKRVTNEVRKAQAECSI